MTDNLLEVDENKLEEVSGGSSNKDLAIEITGTVKEVLANGQYIVQYENRNITCHISGAMRQNRIKVNVDDKVVVQLSPYDITKGRIVTKNK